jgi:hypothetical protein
MGNTWEVYVWKEIKGEFQYILLYSGESRRSAMRIAKNAKEKGAGCIKIEWR